jgi:sortase A
MGNHTALADPAAPPPADPPAKTVGDWVRFGLRGIGQTLITAGLVVLLFVVYEVWITNIFADRNNARHIRAFRAYVNSDVVDPLNLPGGKVGTIPVGSNIGILYIPRLGRDYAEAIVQGNTVPDDSQLEQGTAHYGSTQLPGEVGNFAIAGHRVGKGEPFLNLDHLRSGDPVIVETKSYWFVYRVLGQPAGADPQADTPFVYPNTEGQDQVPGREIVDPSDGNVLLPIPNDTSRGLSDATVKLMTMTTCHPKFTASHRMILHAVLDKKIPSNANHPSAMPAPVQALYSPGSE